MVSEADVVAAYRLILGREPEDTNIVTSIASTIGSLPELRAYFLNSEEFRNLSWRPLPLDGPPIAVETMAGTAAVETMLKRVGGLFEYLGRTDPHWSVLSGEAFRKERIAETEKAFSGSGVTDLEALQA